MSYLEEARQLLPQITKDRRYFHMHPELGFREFETAKYVSERLNQLGYTVSVGVGGTGVVALSDGKVDQPVIMFRFDMDALPINEENNVDYISQTPGVMHACGHDTHIAVGLAIAELLKKHRDEFRATFKLVFQPAEEIGQGAAAMIKDGVLEDPKPDYVLAMHIWNDIPAGCVGLTEGSVMAGCDEFRVKIKGKGGHGGVPQFVKDPIVAAAQVIMAIQTVVSRNLSPFNSAVVSIGSIHAGNTSNIIPAEVNMQGTLRSYDIPSRDMVLQRLKEIVENVSAGMGCEGVFEHPYSMVPAANNPEVVKVAVEAARAVDPGLEIRQDYRTGAAEDMGSFLSRIPGMLMLLGSSNAAEGKDFPHHHPKFDVDESVMPTGVAILLETAKRLSEYKA